MIHDSDTNVTHDHVHPEFESYIMKQTISIYAVPGAALEESQCSHGTGKPVRKSG